MSAPEPWFDDGQVRLYLGDCLDVLAALPDASVDSVVTDPPYGLEFMGREWDTFKPAKARIRTRADGRTNPAEGKSVVSVPESYTAGQPFQAWCQAWATECLRVLKPGGHLLAFGGSRTWHRLACAIEDAGFEIRDSLHWLYGSGFPKGLDVSKAIDKAAGAQREVIGEQPDRWTQKGSVLNFANDRPQDKISVTGSPATDAARQWDGWNVALKPAHEPVVLARKPFKGNVAQNVLKHGTGALNIDACRVGQGGYDTPVDRVAGDRSRDEYRTGTAVGPHALADTGRWPPNVLLTHCRRDWYALRHDTPEAVEQAILAYYRPAEGVREVRDGLLRDALRSGQAPFLFAGVRERGAARSACDAVGDRDLPTLRGGVRDLPRVGAERAPQILLGEMPGSSADGEEPEPDGQAPHGSLAGQDGRQPSDEGKVLPVEGRAVPVQGLLVRDGGPAAARDADDSAAVHEVPVRAGAPGGRSGDNWPSDRRGGSCPPRQWGEDGQPAGEPDRDQAGGPLAGASRDREAVRDADGRGGDPSLGERFLAVPADLVPAGWLRYFTYLGDAGCQPAGTREVRTNSHHLAARGGSGYEGGLHGQAGLAERKSGPEVVETWACADDCPVAELDRQSVGTRAAKPSKTGNAGNAAGRGVYGSGCGLPRDYAAISRDDAGGASRFFPAFRWQAKAPASERPRLPDGTAWPVVKPLELMRWLVRLVTPPGGLVLDPFCGTGATGEAAIVEGFRCVLVEKDPVAAELVKVRLSKPIQPVMFSGEAS
jgi:DNA modification methylase